MTWDELLTRNRVGNTITVNANSSAIDRIEYHISEETMDVTMQDGTTWPYPGVVRAITPDMLVDFINGEGYGGSVGRFFNAVVRGRW